MKQALELPAGPGTESDQDQNFFDTIQGEYEGRPAQNARRVAIWVISPL